MEDLTFSAAAKELEIPRTTLYTRLNHLKKNNEALYQSYVIESEGVLKIRHDKLEELRGFLKVDHRNKTILPKENKKQSAEIETLRRSLKQTEERYTELLEKFVSLNDRLQDTNERLLAVLETMATKEPLSPSIQGTTKIETMEHQDAMIESQILNRSQIILEEDDDEEEQNPQTQDGRLLNRLFNNK